MIDPLDPEADLPTVTAKLNELIGAFNERVSSREAELQAMIASLPPGLQRRLQQQAQQNQVPAG